GAVDVEGPIAGVGRSATAIEVAGRTAGAGAARGQGQGLDEGGAAGPGAGARVVDTGLASESAAGKPKGRAGGAPEVGAVTVLAEAARLVAAGRQTTGDIQVAAAAAAQGAAAEPEAGTASAPQIGPVALLAGLEHLVAALRLTQRGAAAGVEGAVG